MTWYNSLIGVVPQPCNFNYVYCQTSLNATTCTLRTKTCGRALIALSFGRRLQDAFERLLGGGGIGRAFKLGGQAFNAQVAAYCNAVHPNEAGDCNFVFSCRCFFRDARVCTHIID